MNFRTLRCMNEFKPQKDPLKLLKQDRAHSIHILLRGPYWINIHVDSPVPLKFANVGISLGVQRPLKEWVFTKNHYFSRDLQSTIPGDYYFNGP